MTIVHGTVRIGRRYRNLSDGRPADLHIPGQVVHDRPERSTCL